MLPLFNPLESQLRKAIDEVLPEITELYVEAQITPLHYHRFTRQYMCKRCAPLTYALRFERGNQGFPFRDPHPYYVIHKMTSRLASNFLYLGPTRPKQKLRRALKVILFMFFLCFPKCLFSFFPSNRTKISSLEGFN